MRIWQRQAGILVLLALMLTATISLAQETTPEPTPEATAESTLEATAEATLIPESTAEAAAPPGPISAAGSAIVTPLLQSLVTASATTAQFTAEVAGTSGGFQRLCAGQADIATANRTITLDEENACQAFGIRYFELTIAYNILAFVSSPAADYQPCLTGSNLNAVFAPSATGQILNWNQVSTPNPDRPLAVILPGSNTPNFILLDSVIEGDGLRADVMIGATDAEIIAALGTNQGAIGVISLPAAQAAGGSVRQIQLDQSGTNACTYPSAEGVELQLYPASESLYLYVNRASLSKSGLTELLNYIASDAAAPAMQASGFVLPTAATNEQNRAIISGDTSTTQIDTPTTPSFQIPAGLTGTVNIGGGAELFGFVSAINTGFATTYPSVVVSLNVEGQSAGFRRLCNGEIDIALASTDLTAEAANNCAANNISTLTLDVGRQAVVLVANATSPYLTCLTPTQLTTIWGVGSTNVVTTWNAVDPNFPASPMTLFSPAGSNTYGDLLITRASGTSTPVRTDVADANNDALYRAAATANVEGSLTYMSWTEYQQVVQNQQGNIQLVQINVGGDCIPPSQDTITNGRYPLSRAGKFIVNRASLARVEVMSFLWYALSDENLTTLTTVNGFIGVTAESLVTLRATLEQAYAQAQADAAAAAQFPEATAEATASVEATAEATAPPAEGTAEATAEITVTPAP